MSNMQEQIAQEIKQEKIFLCEDTIEGIFSGVYEAWSSMHGHNHCHLQVGIDNYRLFSEYVQVETDDEKAWKVSKTVCDRLGYEVYKNLCRALASTDEEKAEAVYKTIVLGFSMKNGKAVMNFLSNAYVAKVFELDRNVGNEAGHMEQFIRFQELKNGVLFSKIGPKNDVLTIIAPHFADRLPLENFMIYDDVRKKIIVHEKEKPWFLVSGETISEDVVKQYSDEEEYFQELFKGFCTSISIKERENLSLQQQMLPLRFQKYMVEFSKN